MMNKVLIHITLYVSVSSNMVASEGECDNPCGDVSNILGEQVVTATLDWLQSETRSCFDIHEPRELSDIGKKCKMDSLLSLMADYVKRSWIPNILDIVRWYEDKVMCKLGFTGVIHNYTAIDTNSFREKYKLQNWTGNAQHLKLHGEILTTCTESVPGSTAFQQVVFIEKCVVYNMIHYCHLKHAKIGLALRLRYSLYTLMEKSRCEAVQLPEQVNHAFDDCFNKSILGWQDQQIDDMELQELSVKQAGDFLGDYTMNVIIQTLQCTKKELGFYDNRTASTNYSVIAAYVKGFQGWKNITKERNITVGAITHCAFDDHYMEERSGSDLFIKMLLEEITFEKCFGLTFASTCGLNSDLAKFFYPILNTKNTERILKHLQSLSKTQLLVNQAMPILKSIADSISTESF